MDYPWPPPYRTRAVQQLIKGLAWGPPTSRAVWAALESPITATAAPTSTTSLPATVSDRGDAIQVTGPELRPVRFPLHRPEQLLVEGLIPAVGLGAIVQRPDQPGLDQRAVGPETLVALGHIRWVVTVQRVDHRGDQIVNTAYRGLHGDVGVALLELRDESIEGLLLPGFGPDGELDVAELSDLP